VETYLATLAGSTLPLPAWAIGVAWVALFAATNHVTLRSQRLLASQTHVLLEDPDRLAHMQRPSVVLTQLGVFTGLLVLTYWLGETLFAFVGGGLVVALATTLGMNLHSLAFAKRLARGKGATGALTLSTAFVFDDIGHRALGGALMLLVAGVVLANGALLGGAVFLGSTGYDFLRRARNLDPPR